MSGASAVLRAGSNPRIAIAQMRSTNDKDHNLNQVKTIIQKAKDQQASVRPIHTGNSLTGCLTLVPLVFSLCSSRNVVTT